MNQNPDPYWVNRWRTLHEMMEAKSNNQALPNPFRDLLVSLIDFGKKQFFYFYFGFTDRELSDNELAEAGYENRQVQLLDPDPTYPPNYVLRTIIDQITFDYDLIQRAKNQALFGSPAQIETLALTNIWCRSLMSNIISQGSPENQFKLLDFLPNFFFFFNPKPIIRLLPYARTALVGIPWTAIHSGNRRDLLATPHELGHFIYWYGKYQQKQLYQELPDRVFEKHPYLENWTEEIFADVFGFIISGEPAILPFALSMINDNAPFTFASNNRIHPIDAVRLDIYLSTLNVIGHVLNLDLSTIMSFYEKKIADLDTIAGSPESVQLANRTGNLKTFPISEIRKAAGEIATDFAFNLLLPLNYQSNWKESGIKGNESENTINLGLPPSPIYDLLRAQPGFNSIASSDFRSAVQDYLQSPTTQAWFNQFENRFNSFQAATHPDPGFPADYEQPTFVQLRETYLGSTRLDKKLWEIILTADGWNTKGPETGPTGGWEADWSHTVFH